MTRELGTELKIYYTDTATDMKKKSTYFIAESPSG